MNDQTTENGVAPDGGSIGEAVQYYKKDFWSRENLKFSEPWYRLEKSVKLISKLAAGKERTLLDVGCGPAALMRFLPPNIRYYGIDIAIHNQAPNLIEADILDSPISFNDIRFDIVIAQGVFEYVGEFQSKKFSEIANLLTEDGKFIVTYTNFSHRRKYIYPAFSNVQSFESFGSDLAHHFDVNSYFPVSHNWKHGHPSRKLLRMANMYMNANIPFISPLLAVEYYFICSPRR